MWTAAQSQIFPNQAFYPKQLEQKLPVLDRGADNPMETKMGDNQLREKWRSDTILGGRLVGAGPSEVNFP
jgi:hypothetical protein